MLVVEHIHNFIETRGMLARIQMSVAVDLFLRDHVSFKVDRTFGLIRNPLAK